MAQPYTAHTKVIQSDCWPGTARRVEEALMNLETSFGRWLRARRRALDLTQDDLARQVGCAIITIQKLEADERRPSRQLAERLADKLRVAPDDRAALIMLARSEPPLDPAPAEAPGSLLQVPKRPSANLPTPLTRLIGRKHDLAALRNALVRSETRLLTLIGPPGIGKTRLSIAVSHEVQAAFADGAFFVALAPLGDPALVLPTIAQTLGIRESAGQLLLETLKAALHTKRLLLVLDNFEHLLDAVPGVVELLEACPGLKALVTSRAALHVRGEQLYALPVLLLADLTQLPAISALARTPAIALFVERAQEMRPDFTLTAQNARTVAEICVRLDGLALAIELAAARIRLLSPEGLLARLEPRLAVLTDGARDLPPRHQTLHAAIGWSYELLDESEQTLFARLGVFVGDWTLAAAETICVGGGLAADAILDVLAQLVNKSLVVVEREQGEGTRYRLLETIRQYARERLSESGEEEGVCARHLDYFTALAEHADLELPGPKHATWLNCLEVERDNLRAALQWSLERNVEAGLRMAAALRNFWLIRGFVGEGRAWLSQLLLQPKAQAPTLTRAKALYAYAFLSQRQDALTLARQLAEESLALYRELGDRQGMASSLRTLGDVTVGLGDYAAGRALVEESVALHRELGSRAGLAVALTALGEIASDRDAAQGRLVLEESLAIGRSLGDQIGVGHNLIVLGQLALRQGDYTTAQRWLEESLAINRGLGNQVAAYSLGALGELAFHRGDYEQARSYYEECRALNKQAGQDPQDPWLLVRMGYIALRQGDLASARATFEQSLTGYKAAGSKLDIAFVLEGLASLAVAQSRSELALRLFAWADAAREAIGDTRPPVEQAEVDRDLATIRMQLDETAFAAAHAEGWAMSMEQALGYGLSVGD